MKFLKYWKYFSALLLLIPVNIYVIGDFLGAGISFPFFKFQITYLGTMVFTIVTELAYVLNGTFHHKTAISVILWTLALIILIGAITLILLITRIKWKGREKIAGILMIFSSLLFLGAIIEQYGLFFHGPAGTAIPVGIPVMFIIGGWVYYEGCKDQTTDEEEEVQGIDEETG